MADSKDKALKSIFRGGAIVFAGTLISKFITLLYRILVGQTGVSEYGQVSVMLSVFSVGLLFSQIGAPNGVQRFVAYYLGKEEKEKAIGSFQTGLKLITVSSLVTSSILFLSAPWLATEIFHNSSLTLLIRLAALALPFRAYAAIGMHLTNALENMHYSVINDKILVNISQLGLAALLISLGYGYVGAAAAYSFTFILGAIIAIYFVYREFPELLTQRSSFTNIKEILNHSWPLIMAGIFGKITGNIDTFMIQSLINSEQVGLYQAAFPFANSLTLGAGIFSGIFLSNASQLVSKDKSKELATTYRTVVKWVSITMAPMFLIGFAFPKALLTLFGPEYYAAANLLRILSLGFLINGLVGPASNIYQAVEKTKINFYTTALVGVSNLILNLLLIPSMGVVGAAWASTASLSIGAVINATFVYKILGKHPFRVSIVKVWLSGIVSISTIYLVNNAIFSNTPQWFFIVDLIIMTGLYGALMILTGSLEEEDLVIMKALRDKTGLELEKLEKFFRKIT